MSIRRWVAWAEQRIAAVVVDDGLHVGLAGVRQGPMTVTFRLRLRRPDRKSLDRLLKLGPTMAQALHVEQVRISDAAEGILVEVPSPAPRTPPADLLARHTQADTVAVGLDQWRRPATVSLRAHPSILFVGPTGRGKTESMKSTLYALARRNPPRALRYLIIAQKRHAWAAFAPAAGCLALVSDPDDAEQALAWAAGDLLAQRGRSGVITPALVIVVDDLINLLKRADVAGYLGEIASLGRGLGIYQLIGTQGAGSKATTGGQAVEDNITARIVYRPASTTAGARAAGRGGVGADALTGNHGDALLIIDDRVRRIATGLSDDRAIMQLPDGPDHRPWAVVDAVPAAPEAIPGITGISTDNRHNHHIRPATPPVDDPRDGHADATAAAGYGGYDGYAGYDADFPLGEGRPLTAGEAAAVRALAQSPAMRYRGDLSLNRLTVAVYGSKSPERVQWIKDALSAHVDDNPEPDTGDAPRPQPPATFDDGDALDLTSDAGREIFELLYQSGQVRFPEPSPVKKRRKQESL